MSEEAEERPTPPPDGAESSPTDGPAAPGEQEAGVAGEDEEGDEEEDEGRSVDAPASRRRFAPFLLVGGIALALFVGRQALPTSHAVVIRLDGERSDVRSVGLSVGPVADGEEPISSVQWRYEAMSRPPQAVRTEVKLPNGEHRFRVEIVRSSGERAETTKVLKVSDEEVTIRVPTH